MDEITLETAQGHGKEEEAKRAGRTEGVTWAAAEKGEFEVERLCWGSFRGYVACCPYINIHCMAVDGWRES